MSPLEQQLSILGIMLVLIVLANIGAYRQSQKRSSEETNDAAHDGVRRSSI